MGLRGGDGGLFADDPFGHAAGDRPSGKPAEPAGPRTFTVAELSRTIQGALERLGRVAVEGEVSRITRAASGHVYFDLKDLDAKLSCTIWKSALAGAARFPIEEGMQVVAHGKLDVYAPRGTYSLIVQRLEQKGLGALLAELERLKEELRAKGWFDRKRPLPLLPARVGVVTSRDGAALQDFLRTRALRWPDYPCVLAHTSVQGKGAAKEIAEAIRRVDALGVDVICVVRGGGSLEDLWAFNERAVAEAVWNTRAPVVSGVGHQTDVTLIDFVADHRAHTPTDAAQHVLPDRAALVEALETSAANLEQLVEGELARREDALRRLARSRGLREPELALELRLVRLEHHARTLGLVAGRRLETARSRLERAAGVLARSNPRAALEQRAARLETFAPRARNGLERAFERRERALAVAAAGLAATSPYRVLARGYSITRRAGSTAPLADAGALAPGEELETLFAAGSVRSRVESVQPGAAAGGAASPDARGGGAPKA
ncbi:MAG: exodeoxyribonuclease VII large subunit [Planctomycetes bacterium]|nr:exodeoxyribonuclease VII large subunit [Planctomycetota bacterium]